MSERKPRLLLVSHAFAPYTSGTSVLLSNLLKEYPGDCMAVAGYSRYTNKDNHFEPPCPTAYLIPPDNKIFQLGYAKFINNNRWLVRSFIRRQIKKFRPDVIMGVFPHSTFFIAAYEVAQENNIPFYAHMHDLWQENYPEGYYAKTLADKYEATILKNASKVFCMTETQAEHYINKHGINPLILPHTISPSDLEKLEYHDAGAESNVLFAGALSDVMNADALGVFSESKKYLHTKTSYQLFTNASAEQLTAFGVDMSGVQIKWVTRRELQQELHTANILFAPLSHKNCSALEVKTVFSTKLLEYLVAGRPILIFAPANSFHASSARKKNWAYVVDQDDPKALATALDRLLNDETLCKQIVQGAFAEARERNAVYFANRLYEFVLQEAKAVLK